MLINVSIYQDRLRAPLTNIIKRATLAPIGLQLYMSMTLRVIRIKGWLQFRVKLKLGVRDRSFRGRGRCPKRGADPAFNHVACLTRSSPTLSPTTGRPVDIRNEQRKSIPWPDASRLYDRRTDTRGLQKVTSTTPIRHRLFNYLRRHRPEKSCTGNC